MRADSRCLGDNTLSELVAGALPDPHAHSARSHLEACSRCRRLGADLVRALQGGAGCPEAVSPLTPGCRLGRFALVRRIGHGGMGLVFEAHDTELDRPVALKVLREADDRPQARQRLRAEGQALARLSHPNVLTVYEVGEADERTYLVMELIDGVTLADWLDEARPGVPAVLGLMAAAGQGLAAAHRAGLVHRDFKPENVLVSRTGRACLADFGLALVPDAPLPEEALARTSPSAERLLLGTPPYMSPEQLEGRAGDARSDQFAFSVTLYEALHGARPFAARRVEELRAAMASGAFRPGPRTAEVPPAVDRVLQRGLAFDRSARFDSMDALLAELEQAIGRR